MRRFTSTRLIVCAVLLATAIAAQAAEFGGPIFHSVGDLSTIPDGIVADITQDRSGFLWVATHDGLVRYDGYEFRLYRHDPKNKHSLSENRIRTIEGGDDGRLWIATTTAGVSIYDPRSDHFQHLTKNNGLSANSARVLVRDGGGMWIATSGGLDFVDYKTMRVTHFDVVPAGDADPKKRNDIGSLLRDRGGNLWIGSVAGLTVRRVNGRVESIPSLDGMAVYRVFETEQGTLWISIFGGGLFILDPATGRLQEVDGTEKPRAYTLAQPSTEQVWVGTPGDGIEVRDAKSGALLQRIRHDVGIEESIDSDRVRSLFIDRSGIVWIGTWGDGLNRYTPADAAFRLIRYSPEQPDGLTNRDIGSILEASDGRIWIGTRGNGIDIFEDGQRVDGIRSSKNDPNSLVDSHVPAIIENEGAIWIGTRAGAVHRYDRKTRRIRRYEIRSAADTSSTVNTLEPTRDGGIWVGLTAGLVHLDPRTGIATPQQFDDGKPVRASVSRILYDRNGVLWVGTHAMLAALVPGADKFHRVSGTTSELIQDLLEDRKGRLWIGTSEGLDRLVSFDGRNARFEPIGPRIGRDGLRCENLLEDDRGRIWVDADLMFDPETMAFREFSRAEGAGRVIWNGAAEKLRDGRLLYGGPEGILVIDPALLQTWSYTPPVALTAVRVDGIKRQPGTSLTLEPRTRSVGFEFAALDFSAPEQNRYAYRLRGFEKKWTEVDASRRSATYTNLPPGDYVLEIRGSNRAGIWNTRTFNVPLRVKPAFYQTLPFRVAVIVALLGATYPIYRARLRYLKRKQRALEELVHARTADLEVSERRALEASQAKSIFLATMSHELRTPLNAILGFAQLMRRSPTLSDADRQTVGIIRRSGEHLLGLINDVLSIAKIEAGKLILDPRPFDVREMIATVDEMMRVRADAVDVQFDIDTDSSFPHFVQGDEGKLRQVLINLLGNAIKFSPRGKVLLRSRWIDGRAHFEVADTGVGIAADELPTLFEPFVQTASGRTAKEGTGLGLTVTQHIVQAMGGEISVDSEVGKGTTFRFDVVLPLADGRSVASNQRVAGLAAAERPRRILVADDTVENRTLLRNLLELTGFQVREASNGAEALDVWSDWKPELIFMDVRMPIVDGREAIRRIRAAEAGTDVRVPIVALTASVFENERKAVLDLGADDFLMKPFREETIFDALGRLLDVQFAYEEVEPVVTPLRALAGLDVDEGIRRASGNKALYEQLVEEFGRENKRFIPRLEALIEAGSLNEARNYLHTLRGSAATIGARRLAEAAGALEISLGAGSASLDELRGAFDEFTSSAAALSTSRPAPQMQEVAAPVSPSRTRELIDELGALLAENNLDAVERFGELRGALGTRSSASLMRIQSAIDRLDFHGALGELPDLEKEVTRA